MHDERLYADRVLRAGARGYVMKRELTDTIRDAIRRVIRGELVFSERFFQALQMIGHFDSSGSQSLRRGVYRSIDPLPTRS